MKCTLQIMDEEFNIEKKVGTISTEFLQKLGKYAQQENLSFLSFIDENGETIFNIPQLNHIQNELLILRDKYPSLDPQALQTITEAVEGTIKENEYTYLKITCS